MKLTHTYLVALGSNQVHHRFGPPITALVAAAKAVAKLGQNITLSKIITSRPIGPSQRSFANAALVIESDLVPEELLTHLKQIETGQFGRHAGQRWGARSMDLDIVLWSGGIWASKALSIPHPEFRKRTFVLGPAAEIAPDWRDPISSLSLRQLNGRLTKPQPIPR